MSLAGFLRAAVYFSDMRSKKNRVPRKSPSTVFDLNLFSAQSSDNHLCTIARASFGIHPPCENESLTDLQSECEGQWVRRMQAHEKIHWVVVAVHIRHIIPFELQVRL